MTGTRAGPTRAAGRWQALLPQRADYTGARSAWRVDVAAGVTVGLVALPLALAFGITTGLGAAAGLTTAIVAGLVAGVFGGSDVQVSGPTGAMTVVLVPLVAHHGPGSVAAVGLLAGLLVVLAGVLGLGRLLVYVPWPVIEGFTVGIAAIIFLQQVPAALGVPAAQGENPAAVAVRSAAGAPGGSTPAALLVTATVVLVMVVGPRLHRSLPASLVAVVLATAATTAFGWDLDTIGTIPSSLPLPALPRIDAGALGDLLPAAGAVALLAALESLLSAKVADGMSDRRRHQPNRELVGQGLANVASPMFGGMPATGAIARTAVNVRSGARTRLATLTHALVLLLVVLVGSGLVARIPLPALAGVLIVTAVRMVDVANARGILRSTKADAAVLVGTAAATIAFDLIAAIALGLVLAGFLALVKVAQATGIEQTELAGVDRVEIDDDTERDLLDDHVVAYRIDGSLFFGAAQRFLDDLTDVADVRVVILRLPQLQVLDATGAQALGTLVGDLESRGVTVLLKGLRPDHSRTLTAVGALDRIVARNHLFDDLDAAIAHAREHARRADPH